MQIIHHNIEMVTAFMTTTSNAMQFSPVQSVKHRQGGVQQLLEMRTCDRRKHCPRRWTRAMHHCLFLTQGSLWSSTSPSGFEVLQKCLCSHNCFQEEYPGFSNQAFLHLGLWASLVWKTHMSGPSQTPAFSFEMKASDQGLQKLHFDALWSYGELALVLRPAP